MSLFGSRGRAYVTEKMKARRGAIAKKREQTARSKIKHGEAGMKKAYKSGGVAGAAASAKKWTQQHGTQEQKAKIRKSDSDKRAKTREERATARKDKRKAGAKAASTAKTARKKWLEKKQEKRKGRSKSYWNTKK